MTTTSEQISQAIRQIDTYLNRFRDRLKGSNEMHLRQVRATLTGLEKMCLNWSESKKSKDGKGFQVEEILTASQVVQKMGGNLDTINVSKKEWTNFGLDYRLTIDDLTSTLSTTDSRC